MIEAVIDFGHLDCWQREEFFKRVDAVEEDVCVKRIEYVKCSGDIINSFIIRTTKWVISRIQDELKAVEKLHLGKFEVST